ncbi:MAG: hypothetical protein WBG86_14840 [Polyangiales bacterium]
MQRFAFLLSILCITGGCVLEDKPVDPDGGIGGTGGANRNCDNCTGNTPACDEDTDTCVQCTADDTRACTGDTPACDANANVCVGCVTTTDCTQPSAPRCDTENDVCIECQSPADCDHIPDAPICDEGTCVQCTPENEATDCEGNSCNPTTLTCTSTAIASLETCEACVSDTECAETGNRCVAMEYQGDPFPDSQTGFCLKTTEGGCEQPFSITLADGVSFSGPPVEDYCGINTDLATCPAVHALVDNQRCNGGQDEECPQPSGLCREVGNLQDRCTYPCESVVECLEDQPAGRPGSECGTSGSSSKDYCGG